MTEGPVIHVTDARWQQGVVKAIEPRTPRIKSFFIAPSVPFAFDAGQHVDLRLTAESGYTAMRSYSIGSSPAQADTIELSIERLSNGEVSPFFHDAVLIGDQIELRGPLGGHFVWRPDDGGPLLLIGGGSGVVPLMAMIRHQQSVLPQLPVVLLLSARTWDDALYRDELLAFDARLNGFRLALALTREAPHRARDYGRRVDAAMVGEQLIRLPDRPKLTYICGANQFANVAAESALACNVDAASIRTERYGA
jgi:ferredoxin-NADP reductase